MIKFIRGDSTDAAHNLALEQYLFESKKPEESIIFLWQNDNAVVVGRYQNVFEEVDIDYAKSVGAKIVRRITGGGAVYHDLGNLNYSFIIRNEEELKVCSEILMNALYGLGLNVYFEGRNDIFLDGYKISGCASYREKNKILHHGTLLIDSNLKILERVLTRKNKIDSKSVKSQPKQVQNITSFIPDISVETVMRAITAKGKILEDNPRISELIHTRYSNEQWTYGFPPSFNYKNSKKYEAGQVCVNADIAAGKIQDIKFSGDFIALRNIEELEEQLKGYSIFELDDFIHNAGDGFMLGIEGKDLALLFQKL